MSELTPEEKKFLLMLLEKTPITATVKQLKAVLEMIASIQNKLQA